MLLKNDIVCSSPKYEIVGCCWLYWHHYNKINGAFFPKLVPQTGR